MYKLLKYKHENTGTNVYIYIYIQLHIPCISIWFMGIITSAKI